MSTASGGSAARASVAFLKIQEFARRPVMDQMRLRAQLEAVIAVITADDLADAAQKAVSAASSKSQAPNPK